jgi:hypothetical protein
LRFSQWIEEEGLKDSREALHCYQDAVAYLEMVKEMQVGPDHDVGFSRYG